MPGLSRIVAAVLMVAAFLVASPRTARGDVGRPKTLHVLAIDSDDADEQADALTGALRAHIRQAPGWTLLETSQSLSMLTAAFRCPQRPDPACLVRIGDKLQTNQFIWGVMNKVPNHQVAVDVHLWSRGKPDVVARETFSDNLKESSDDALGKIATAILSKLIGESGGFLVLHANADAGTVLVDGQQVGTLDHGRMTIPLLPGPHTVEVHAVGFINTKRDITMTSGASVQLDVLLDADAAAAPTTTAGGGKPFPTRAVIGWSAIGVGVVLGVVGIVEGVGFLNDQSDLNAAIAGPPKPAPGQPSNGHGNYGVTSPSITDPCKAETSGTYFGNPYLVPGCNAINAAHSAVVSEIVTFSVGGALAATGMVVLLTGRSKDSDVPAKTGLRSIHLLPTLGIRNGSMTVVGRF